MCYIGNASLTGAAGHDLLPGPGQPLIRRARGGALSLERRHPLGAQFEVIRANVLDDSPYMLHEQKEAARWRLERRHPLGRSSR